MKDKYNKFNDLTYEKFKEFAKDESLSHYEKIGFPDDYRKGFEEHIFHDIIAKTPVFSKKNALVVDIGPGCSELPRLIIQYCCDNHHNLILIDSQEMLDLLPDAECANKHAAKFPECEGVIAEYKGKVDAVIIYSVLQHVFIDNNLFAFLDKAVSLLAPGGTLLIGDIPNITKRKRFFSSSAGIKTHQAFTNSKEIPAVKYNELDEGKIDDGVIFSILYRYRNAGYETYLLPQNNTLPLYTRREDIIIQRP